MPVGLAVVEHPAVAAVAGQLLGVALQLVPGRRRPVQTGLFQMLHVVEERQQREREDDAEPVAVPGDGRERRRRQIVDQILRQHVVERGQELGELGHPAGHVVDVVDVRAGGEVGRHLVVQLRPGDRLVGHLGIVRRLPRREVVHGELGHARRRRVGRQRREDGEIGGRRRARRPQTRGVARGGQSGPGSGASAQERATIETAAGDPLC